MGQGRQVPGRGDEGEAEQQEQVGRVSHEGDGGMDVNLCSLFDSSQDHIFLQDARGTHLSHTEQL